VYLTGTFSNGGPFDAMLYDRRTIKKKISAKDRLQNRRASTGRSFGRRRPYDPRYQGRGLRWELGGQSGTVKSCRHHESGKAVPPDAASPASRRPRIDFLVSCQWSVVSGQSRHLGLAFLCRNALMARPSGRSWRRAETRRLYRGRLLNAGQLEALGGVVPHSHAPEVRIVVASFRNPSGRWRVFLHLAPPKNDVVGQKRCPE